MRYNIHNPESNDPMNTEAEALDDRNEKNIFEKAAWNDESDPVNHL